MRLDNGNPITHQRRHKAANNGRSRATSFLPTSNPSPISGRLGHQKVHWERARTPRAEPKTPGSLQINLLFTMYAEQAHCHWQTQTFFLQRQGNQPLSSQHQNLGGAERDRTADPLLAKQVLSQLSYSPIQVSIPDRMPRNHWNGGPGQTRTADLTLIRRAL